jgi:hypothetical protein
MSDLLTRLKPATSRKVRMLLAAATWTAVGLVMIIVGTRWALRSDTGLPPILFVAAVAAGLAKAAFILRPAANRVVLRIRALGDDRCIGGFYSWRTWMLVALMIAAGALLRGTGVSLPLVGLLYLAIGVSLLTASWLPWRAWYRDPAHAPADNGVRPF